MLRSALYFFNIGYFFSHLATKVINCSCPNKISLFSKVKTSLSSSTNCGLSLCETQFSICRLRQAAQNWWETQGKSRTDSIPCPLKCIRHYQVYLSNDSPFFQCFKLFLPSYGPSPGWLSTLNTSWLPSSNTPKMAWQVSLETCLSLRVAILALISTAE